MRRIEQFFADIDAAWQPQPSEGRVRIELIGSVALMLQTDYDRGTKDSDVLKTRQSADVVERLGVLAGRDSVLHRKHRMYLDPVLDAILLLPQQPNWHPCEALNGLVHFEVFVLDIVDVVVSKLKRFSPQDREDITEMIRRGHVEHGPLVERFKLGLDMLVDGAYGEDAPRWCANLNTVEREELGVAETEIELPSWIGR